MHRLIISLALALSLVPLGVTGVSAASGDYIVRYKDGAVTRAAPRMERLGARRARLVDGAKLQRHVRSARSQGIRPKQVFRHSVGGFSARLTAAQVRDLRADPAVASVVPDLPIRIADDEVQASIVTVAKVSPQKIPAGIRRIGANRQPLAHIGTGKNTSVDIAVFDTGIAAHPDLRIAGGVDCIGSGGVSYSDKHGHGTHVAGIIGAKDNEVGIVGVVPGARLWSIKVIADNGKGLTSELLCGLDWLIAQQLSPDGPDFVAANMSIAGPLDFPNAPCAAGTEDMTHVLMCTAMDLGVTFAVAAANDSRVVDKQPAIYEEPITVGAIVDYDGKAGGLGSQAAVCPWASSDADDTYANFSNWGKGVDILAPGKCVLSTYTGKRYAWMSGTSMATPYVAGAIALFRLQFPDARPQQVKRGLVTGGTLDWRTGTSPDGRKYPLLQVRSLAMPLAKVVVPKVRGMTPAQAKQAIRAAGFKVKSTVLSVAHATIPKGMAVNTLPSHTVDGTPRKLLEGTTIQLKVSTGPPKGMAATTKVAVPKIRGMSLSKARAVLKAAGLKVGTSDLKVNDPKVAKGKAINTIPTHLLHGKPRKLTIGTVVRLKVSKGP